jgi:predicted kinase
MNKPTQFLLVGFPYSGKTTLAKKLESRLGFVHINIDKLKSDMGYSKVGDDDVPDKIWQIIFSKADKRLVKYLKEGKNVANEYAWITRKWRNKAKKVALDAGFLTKIIYLKVSVEEIKKRWKENSQTRNRFHWPEEEFLRMFREFEEPDSDENIILYDEPDLKKMDDWIKRNTSLLEE